MAFERWPFATLPPVEAGSVPLTPEAIIRAGAALPGAAALEPDLQDLARAFAAALSALPRLLPWIWPPESVIPFCQPQVNTPINVAAAATVTLVSYQIHAGRAGRITHFGVAGSDFANLRWTLFLRGNPVPPVAGLVLQYGSIAAPTLISGGGIAIGPQDDIQVQVVNIGAGIISGVQARIDGYLWDL